MQYLLPGRSLAKNSYILGKLMNQRFLVIQMLRMLFTLKPLATLSIGKQVATTMLGSMSDFMIISFQRKNLDIKGAI